LGPKRYPLNIQEEIYERDSNEESTPYSLIRKRHKLNINNKMNTDFNSLDQLPSNYHFMHSDTKNNNLNSTTGRSSGSDNC